MITVQQAASLDKLRENVRGRMSEKRFFHTSEVEKTAARLAGIYLPEEEYRLRAAGLLHDIAKETDILKQLEICEKYGDPVPAEDLRSPKTVHARTGALLIPAFYPDFNDPLIISAVRWHTTSRSGAELFDKLIYLADYIDMSRKFEDCVLLREYFFSADPDKMSAAEKLRHLDRTLIKSFDLTICDLVSSGKTISSDTVAARNSILISL